jgi:glycosyltransferase involved in cell wall biosynthesis
MPLVSIIIPVYNGEQTLAKCLKSIFDQTFRDFKIIVVNDGSTDQTPIILSHFSDTVTVVEQENRGAAVARNIGAKKATGEFLLFCDADIILEPNALAAMVEVLQKYSEVSYAYSAFKFGWKTFTLFPFDAERLRKMPYIHTTSLIRREHFPGFDETLKRFQDWDLWLTMLEQNHVGYFIPKILFTIINAKGTMSTWLPKIAFILPWQSEAVKKYCAAEKIIKDKHHLA